MAAVGLETGRQSWIQSLAGRQRICLGEGSYRNSKSYNLGLRLAQILHKTSDDFLGRNSNTLMATRGKMTRDVQLLSIHKGKR